MKFENLSARMEAEGKKQKFFEILVEGEFRPEQIETVFVENSLKRDETSEAFFEEQWQELIKSGFKPWPNDTKPTRYRFVDARQEGDNLSIVLDPCVSYRDFSGSNSPEFPKKFGSEYNPNPLAITTLINTYNNKGEEMVMLTLRNITHDDKPGGYHGSMGGFMEIKKDKTVLDPVYREVKEEIGLEKNELENLICLGIVAKTYGQNPDMIFAAKASIKAEEIEKRSHDKENEIIFVPADRIKLQQWLLAPIHAGVVPGVAALLFFGKQRFGEDWYKEMNKALAWRSEDYEDKSKRDMLEKRDVGRLETKVKALRNKKE